MKKAIKKSIVLFACLILVITGVVLWFYTSKKKSAFPETETCPDTVKAKCEATELSETVGYIIGNYKGSVAIFESGKTAPVKTTSVLLKELPPADRELLKAGISVNTPEELNELLEDYCS